VFSIRAQTRNADGGGNFEPPCEILYMLIIQKETRVTDGLGYV